MSECKWCWVWWGMGKKNCKHCGRPRPVPADEVNQYKVVVKNFIEIMRSGVKVGEIALMDLAKYSEDLLERTSG